MNIFGLTIQKQKKENRAKTDGNFPLFSFGNRSLYGIDIQNPTVSSAIDLISGTIAKLPFNLYFRKNDDSRIKATFHPLYTVIKRAPNSEESIFTFKNRLVRYLLTNGNAYIFKVKAGSAIKSLVFFNPSYVTVTRTAAGEKVFSYNGTDYTSAEVLHIPALDYDGLVGHSPLESAAYAVELGNSLDEYAKNSISNGVNSGLMVDTTDYLAGIEDKDEYTKELNNIGRYYANHNTGPDNAGKPLVMLPKTKGTPVTLSSNRDAQLQESRDFQIREIAKIFKLQLPLLTGNFQGTDTEQITQLFLSFTLSPWIRLIESYLNQLLTPYEQERLYFEANTDPVLTVSTSVKFAAYRTAIESGIYSVNDVLAKENMPALSEALSGSVHFVPVNVMPLTDDNVNSVLAQSKLKLQQMKDGNHNPKGDDKN